MEQLGLLARGRFAIFAAANPRRDFGFLQRHRTAVAVDLTQETGHADGLTNEVPGLVIHLHLDQNVTRKNFALDDHFLGATQLGFVFGRHQDVRNAILQTQSANATLEILLDLFFLTGIRMHGIPVLGHDSPCRNRQTSSTRSESTRQNAAVDFNAECNIYFVIL